MKKIFIFCLILLSQTVWSKPRFLVDLGRNDQITTVNGIINLGQNNDPACSGSIFIDEILSFKYIPLDGAIKIETKKSHSPDGLFLNKQDLVKFDFDENNYLSMFLKTKEKVIFLGEVCGSGGYFNINGMIKISEITKLH